MNQTLKFILCVAVVILSVSALVGRAFADEITGTLTVGTDSSGATGTLTTGLNGSADNGVSGVVIVSPVASPAAGTYTLAQSVTLSAAGASSINYTTDGSAPTCSSGNVYNGAIPIGSSQTIQAISCYPGNNASAVASFAYAINIPSASVSSGGGGGGGGGSYYVPQTPIPAPSSIPGQVLGASTVNPSDILALLQGLMQQLVALEQQLITRQFKDASCSFVFNNDLSQGMTNGGVLNLQKALNFSSLTQVAASGIGSPGYESTYFGNATKKAVIAFQNIFASQILAPNGMTSGNGYAGAATRKELNTLCGQ